MSKIPWLLLLAGVALALRFVPGFPRFYLDDPNRWAVAGCLAAVAVMVLRGWHRPGVEVHTRTLTVVLGALPVVYVADWLRFGGSALWLTAELSGVVVFWSLAWAGLNRGPRFLAWGIGLHAAWDLMHLGTSHYVPDWYVIACVIIDLTLTGVTLLLIRESRMASTETDGVLPTPVVDVG